MTDIVERLKWLKNNLSAVDLSQLEDILAVVTEAIDTIERLHSICGKADVGASFAKITKDFPRNEPNTSG